VIGRGKSTRDPEFGPPTNPRRVNFYGRLKRGADAKRFRVNRAWDEALVEDHDRREAKARAA
jgi:hypothetical protein